MSGELLYFIGVFSWDIGLAFLGRIRLSGVEELFKLRVRIRLGCRHLDVEYIAAWRARQKKQGQEDLPISPGPYQLPGRVTEGV